MTIYGPENLFLLHNEFLELGIIYSKPVFKIYEKCSLEEYFFGGEIVACMGS